MKSPFLLTQRASGLLLHPTSLPGPHGCGDLGPSVYAFVDFLASARQRWWQMLPVNPPGPGNTPYSARSAFAGSPLLISLEWLLTDGLLARADLKPTTDLRTERVAYPATFRFRLPRLRKAYDAFLSKRASRRGEFDDFRSAQGNWLADYALFTALHQAHRGVSWTHWPADLRRRKPAALDGARRALAGEVGFHEFVQYQFDRQWSALRRYARACGVGLLGDIPIFVAHDSADVWAHPELFQLDAQGRPRFVSGTPPDLFSRTGQLWGHPHYRWPRHRADGFAWWLARFGRVFKQFDAVRIDHFPGFDRVWTVPGRAHTAQRGHWAKTPGLELFLTVRRKLGPVGIIAEDLGVVSPGAVALRARFGFPGMRLLHFAFEHDGEHYHEPDAFPRNCVVYPGTHDNETTVGWFRALRASAPRQRRERVRDVGALSKHDRVLRYLGTDGREIHWDIIRLALSSVADLAIIPVQDVLGLGNEARMNIPATAAGNWEWRLRPNTLTRDLAARLHDLAVAYDRVRGGRPQTSLPRCGPVVAGAPQEGRGRVSP